MSLSFAHSRSHPSRAQEAVDHFEMASKLGMLQPNSVFQHYRSSGAGRRPVEHDGVWVPNDFSRSIQAPLNFSISRLGKGGAFRGK